MPSSRLGLGALAIFALFAPACGSTPDGAGGSGEQPGDDAAVHTADAAGAASDAGGQSAMAKDASASSDDSGSGNGATDATASTDGTTEPDAATASDGNAHDATASTIDAASQDAATGAVDASTTADAGATGQTGNTGSCSSSNPATVPLPVIGSKTFSITSYGAKGDGKTDNTTAIQAALDAANTAGGGVVTVPSGTFLSGPIVLHNATRLDVASGATLEMLPMGTYPGTTAFITASSAHDIALTGAGTIEGQGQAWWNALTATPSLQRPQEVSFSKSTRVLISGVRLQNPPEEHIWVKGDTDVTITGITINTLAVAGQHIPNNTDGVDISANGVFFCNNNVACGDDNVVMEGTSIYVGYSQFGVGHGCTIGSITTGGVSNVTVDHVDMTGTTAGIRMKSARDRGGLVTNLTYSNMTLKNVTNPISVESYYPTVPSAPTADTAQAVTSTTPYWENITLKNITITGSPNAGILWGLPEAKISNFTLDNVNITATKGFDIYNATGVTFTGGSTVTVSSGPPVIVYDSTVTGITTHTYP